MKEKCFNIVKFINDQLPDISDNDKNSLAYFFIEKLNRFTDDLSNKELMRDNGIPIGDFKKILTFPSVKEVFDKIAKKDSTLIQSKNLLNKFYLSPETISRNNESFILDSTINSSFINYIQNLEKNFNVNEPSVLDSINVVSDSELESLTDDKETTLKEGKLLGLHIDGNIYINNSLTDDYEKFRQVLLHETTHKAADRLIEQNEEFKDEINSLIQEAYNLAKQQNLSNEEGFKKLEQLFSFSNSDSESSSKEFIAEVFSSNSFQNLLNNITVNDAGNLNQKKKKNIFEKLIYAFQKFFGLDVKDNSMLYKAFTVIDDFKDFGTTEQLTNDAVLAEEKGKISSFRLSDDVARFTKTIYPYDELTVLAGNVLKDFNQLATNTNYQNSKEIIKDAKNEQVEDELKQPKDNKKQASLNYNQVNAHYYPQVTRNTNERDFDLIISSLNAGDLIRVNLRKSNGEFLTDDNGKTLTKWFPAIYANPDKNKVQFAKSYGKYNTDVINYEDIVGYRELAGESQDKLSDEAYEKLAKENNIYVKSSALAQKVKTDKFEFLKPKRSVFTTLTDDDNNFDDFLSEGDQVLAEVSWNKDGERTKAKLWFPVARVLAGGVEVVSKNGKPFILPMSKIKKKSYRVKRIKDLFNRELTSANNQINQSNEDNIETSIKNNPLYKVSKINTEKILEMKDDLERGDEAPEELLKAIERRKNTIKSLSFGDKVLVQFNIDGKKIFKWVNFMTSGDYAVLAAWKKTGDGSLVVQSFSFDDVYYVGYDQKNTKLVYDKMIADTKQVGKFSMKANTDVYYNQVVRPDNRKKLYRDLKVGDLVKIKRSNDYTLIVPIVEIDRGKVYFGNLRSEDRDIELKTFTKKLRKGYYRQFLKPEDMIQVSYRYEAVPEFINSGHPRKAIRRDQNDEVFSKEMTDNKFVIRSAEEAKAFNKKYSGSPVLYVPLEGSKDYVKVFRKTGKPIKGLTRLYVYKDTSPFTGEEATELKDRMFENMKAGDYIELKYKGSNKFFKKRILSIDENNIYYTNKKKEVVPVSKSRIVFPNEASEKNSVIIKSFGARRSRGSDISWVYKSSKISTTREETFDRVPTVNSFVVNRSVDYLLETNDIEGVRGEEVDIKSNVFTVDPQTSFIDSGIPALLLGKELNVNPDEAQQYLNIMYYGYAEGYNIDDFMNKKDEIRQGLNGISNIISKNKAFKRVTPKDLNNLTGSLLREKTIDTTTYGEAITTNKNICKI